MLVVGLIFVGVAAVIHVYIFVLESLRWSAPATRKTFGIRSQEQADATRPLAFNQGFYNLFLAATAGIGIVFVSAAQTAIGVTLIVAGAGSMVLAGFVLLLSSRGLWRAALVQCVPPALGLLFLALTLVA